MVREFRSNRNVFFCKRSHVLWSPTYRRKLLVGRIETRLTQSISEVCQAHQAELEKLEMMSDHVQLLVNVDPPVVGTI